ncbi:hypothetical protein B0H13DRAFT_1856108 [Mycena leptocephala]|nr:hypothetical protein B0H13DRAFT_1856108 [Mycena leptocephala]
MSIRLVVPPLMNDFTISPCAHACAPMHAGVRGAAADLPSPALAHAKVSVTRSHGGVIDLEAVGVYLCGRVVKERIRVTCVPRSFNGAALAVRAYLPPSMPCHTASLRARSGDRDPHFYPPTLPSRRIREWNYRPERDLRGWQDALDDTPAFHQPTGDPIAQCSAVEGQSSLTFWHKTKFADCRDRDLCLSSLHRVVFHAVSVLLQNLSRGQARLTATA